MPEKAEQPLEYEIETPGFYIQGSYVMDRIFGTNTARDVDVFIPEGSNLPKFETDLDIQYMELSPDFYFPPGFGVYNTDKYLLVEGKVVFPNGYPEKPTEVFYVDTPEKSVEEVVKGVKYSIRYGLGTEKVEEEWKNTLKKQFDPEFMQALFMENEDEVVKFINYFIDQETSEEEKQQVKERVEELLERIL